MKVSARHFARLGAVQYLYAWMFQQQSMSDSENQILLDAEILLHGDLKYLQKLLGAIPSRIPEIDSVLSGAIDRKIETIDPVELSILRLGVYELMSEPDVPPKVVADECIRLAKEFGNPGSYKFINGTLDKLAFRDGVQSQTNHRKSSPGSTRREFELIDRYFTRTSSHFENVVTGVGDDSAVVRIPDGKQVVVSTDTLLEGVHFPVGTAPEHIGYKSLAVGLSDLAAMGAQPAFAVLNLSMPRVVDEWMGKFSAGFFELADQFGVALVGGDTVRGPLGVTVTVFGHADPGACMLRSGAKPGDQIYITGTLGDAALGLMIAGDELESSDADAQFLAQRLNRPSPRVEAARVLRPYATSAIDISDGLLADLGHILDRSEVGAQIELERIPISNAYRKVLSDIGWDPALSHGDDYELCITIPGDCDFDLVAVAKDSQVPIRRIGHITEQRGLDVRDSSQERYEVEQTGFSHF